MLHVYLIAVREEVVLEKSDIRFLEPGSEDHHVALNLRARKEREHELLVVRVICAYTHLLFLLPLSRFLFPTAHLDLRTVLREALDIAPNVLAFAALDDRNELVIDDRRALEEPKTGWDELARAAIVPESDQPLPHEGQRHLAPEGLCGDERVDDDVSRNDPLYAESK